MYRYVGIAGKTIETHHAPPSASMFSQMTVVLILTGMVNSRVEHFTTCDSETAQSRTAGLGSGVTVQASCYSNGTVSYSWSSSSNVWYLQIEYQCYNNGTTHEQTPNPVTQVRWSNERKSGDGTLNIQPWEEGTTCNFSGCYEDEDGIGFPIYSIPDTICIIHTSMTAEILTKSSSLTPATPMSSLLPMSSYTVLQQVPATPRVHPTPMLKTATPRVHPTPMLKTTTPTVHPTPMLKTATPRVHPTPMLKTAMPRVHPTPMLKTMTPTVHPTPMLKTQSPPQRIAETSIVMIPNTETPSEHSIAVTVVLVLITLTAMLCVVSTLVVTLIKKTRPKARPTFVMNEELIGGYPPISLSSYKPTQVSQETLLNVLEKPHPQDYVVSSENTLQAYTPSISEDRSSSDSTNELSELSNMQDNHSDIAKAADGSNNIADSVSLSTQMAKEEEKEEVVEEEKDEEKEEKVEEDESEKDGRRKEMHYEPGEHIAYIEEKSATCQSFDCTKHHPEGEFTHCVDEPFMLDDNEPIAHSIINSELSYTDDDDHLCSVPFVPGGSSESSGYISPSMWNLGKHSC